MQATADHHWRSVAIWKHGLLDRLPEAIEHGIVACTRDEAGFAILMHNLSHTLIHENQPISEQDHTFLLETMATLHAAFWEDPVLTDTNLSLCKVEDFFSHTSPKKAERIAGRNSSFVLDMIIQGRHLIPKFVDKDLADLINGLVIDPSPLCSLLAQFPQTLVHSDVRLANLGIKRGVRSRLIMLDWARPTLTVPAVDLIYYLHSTSSAQRPISVEQSINFYKEQLANRLGRRFDEQWWQPQLELSLLGVFATMCCFDAWVVEHADDELRRKQELADLELWAEQASRGVKWIAS